MNKRSPSVCGSDKSQRRIEGFWIRGQVQISRGGSISAVWPIFPEIPHENNLGSRGGSFESRKTL